MRLRIAYIIVSIPLILWLLLANVELRYYRDTRLAHDINDITTGLTASVQQVDRALQRFDGRDNMSAVDWLVEAERDLVGVQNASRGYNVVLNRRLSTSQGTYLDLGTAAGMYAQEIRSVRQHVERDGQFSPADRALLLDIAADLRILKEGLPGELLLRARRDELQPLMGSLSKSFKVESIRQWFNH